MAIFCFNYYKYCMEAVPIGIFLQYFAVDGNSFFIYDMGGTFVYIKASPMNDIDLYGQILGIVRPWFVEEVMLQTEADRVGIRMAHEQTTWACPKCGRKLPCHSHSEERAWRHLDTCQFKTFIYARIPQVDCPKHGVHQVRVPWAKPKSLFTLLMERMIIDVVMACSTIENARIPLRLSRDETWNVMESAPNVFATRNGPLIIAEQGSFTVGGAVITTPGVYTHFSSEPEGQTLHGDHAYVFYQAPLDARKLPLVLWHGHGQSSKCFESTPDRREGFQNIFLRRNFSVYMVDQPRRGKAGRSTEGVTISPKPDEQLRFNQYRVGVWPDFYPGVSFSKDPEALNQYFRQMTPNTGPINVVLNSDAIAALFSKIGPGILVTHSHSCGMGWDAVIKSPNIHAVVSYEPGSGFFFPEGEVPPPITSNFDDLKAVGVPMNDFMKLTKIPIIIYYGDNIPAKPSNDRGKDRWRIRLEMARKWAATVNKHGGDARVVHLPEFGVKGNTHFPFSDLNNLEVADLLLVWLKEKGLD